MSYDRIYYTIGQLSKIAGLPQSVLRYWETVFDSLKPAKSNGGTRQYSDNDVKLVLQIKKMLYDEGYTIKGANKLIKSKFNNPAENNDEQISVKPEKFSQNLNISDRNKKTIDDIRRRIKSILEELDS